MSLGRLDWTGLVIPIDKALCAWTESVVPGGETSPLRHHALHPEGFFRVVEAKVGRLAKTQHTALRQADGLSDLEPVDGTEVPTGVQRDDPRPVLDVAVLGSHSGALQVDVHGTMTHCGPALGQGQQGDGGAQTSAAQAHQVGALCLELQTLPRLKEIQRSAL